MTNKVGPTSTTLDWQVHTGPLAVLPIGSFEQHGEHLPLDTDITGAAFFAAMIADDLEAALLPTLPYGTCTEHTGFRGSISLRPETLMTVVRDIADELERQNFKILIVLNGHGGNFALGPAIRDINRLDRSLKILLVNWWDFLDHDIAADSHSLGMDLHAGEMETSFMLALHPEQVRPESQDAPPREPGLSLKQGDLNTFGTGHFCAGGAIGYPSFATAEKGQAIIESVRSAMLVFVRDRVRRLQEQPRYAGRGAIAIRTMTDGDLLAGLRLKELANWNQTANDIHFFLEQSPDGCFAAVHNGQVIGSAATIRYDNQVAWISMVLVDPVFRGIGIGRRLMEQAVAHLSDCPTVRLDATPQGKQLYDKLGFTEEFRMLRLIHRGVPSLTVSPQTSPLPADLPAEIATLDAQLFGADRSALLQRLQREDPASTQILTRDDSLAGFALGRPGTNFHHLGPLVADSTADAIELTSTVFSHLDGQPVVIDVPVARTEFVQWLQSLGFTVQRPLIRMVLGDARMPQPPAQLFAVCGPEFG